MNSDYKELYEEVFPTELTEDEEKLLVDVQIKDKFGELRLDRKFCTLHKKYHHQYIDEAICNLKGKRLKRSKKT